MASIYSVLEIVRERGQIKEITKVAVLEQFLLNRTQFKANTKKFEIIEYTDSRLMPVATKTRSSKIASPDSNLVAPGPCIRGSYLFIDFYNGNDIKYFRNKINKSL